MKKKKFPKPIAAVPKQKLLLTAIVKDDTEYDMFERMLASFMPHFDGLCVAITGLSAPEGTKRLARLIKSYKGHYVLTATDKALYRDVDKDGLENPADLKQGKGSIYTTWQGKTFFANFAAARRECFNLAKKLQETEHYDWWSWADSDDTLNSGEELQNAARIASDAKLDAVYFTYWYQVRQDKDGKIINVQVEHIRERLLSPKIEWKWISRLHEVSLPQDERYKLRQTQYDVDPKAGQRCVWVHLTNTERSDHGMQRNTEILKLQRAEEEGKDPRTLFYLAKIYYDEGMEAIKKQESPERAYDDAEKMIYEYLEISGWAQERSNAWMYLGNIAGNRGEHTLAMERYWAGVKEYAGAFYLYVLLAKEYAELNRHEESEFLLDMIMRKDLPKATTTIGNPEEIQIVAALLKFQQAMRKNEIKDVVHWWGIYLKLCDIDPATDDNMKGFQQANMLNQAGMWVFNYAKWLNENGHTDKITQLLESLPIDLGREQFAHYIANEVKKPRVWGKKEICYFASWGNEHFEQWSGKSLARGIGGSETAVIQLAKQWAKAGYKVTVFGDPREDAGEYEGVTYRPWYEINWHDTFNILIFWRSPHLLDRDIKAKKIFMDLHDVASQQEWSEERMKKVTKVFMKSQYHREMLPKLPDEKVAIISNGITI